MVDSGVGGLTVARAVLDQLPHEALHYVGDTAHSPYGPKPLADVRRYALALLDQLVESRRQGSRHRLQRRFRCLPAGRPRAL